MFISFQDFCCSLQIKSIFIDIASALALPGSAHRLSNTFMTSQKAVYDVFSVLWRHMMVLNKDVGNSIENQHQKCHQKLDSR